MLNAREQLALKAEAAAGTYETLAAADATMKSYNINLTYPSNYVTRPNEAALGSDVGIVGAISSELTFSRRLTGLQAFGDLLYKACGFKSAVAKTYTLSSDVADYVPISAAYFKDGRRKKARGLMGTVTWIWEAGEAVEEQYRMIGGYEADPDNTSLLSSISYESLIPPVWAGPSFFTLNSSTTTPVKRVEIELGNELSLIPSPNATRGWLQGFVGRRFTKMKLSPDAITSRDWYAKYPARTEFTFALVTGASAGNIITMSGTLQLNQMPEDEDRDGKLLDALSCDINTDSLQIVLS